MIGWFTYVDPGAGNGSRILSKRRRVTTTVPYKIEELRSRGAADKAPMGEADKTNDKLAEFLGEIAGMAEFPALSRSIEQVLQKVDEDASLQHITNVILKDYSLTLCASCGPRIPRFTIAAAAKIHSIVARGHAAGRRGGARRWRPGVRSCWSIFCKPSPGLKELILLSLLNREPCARGGRIAWELSETRRSLPLRHVSQSGRSLNRLLSSTGIRGGAPCACRRNRMPAAQACFEVLGFDYDPVARAERSRRSGRFRRACANA